MKLSEPTNMAASGSAKPTPIFVIGMTRSGTKWLSNLLAAHPDVTAIQTERHRGILETSVFGATQAKFNLSSDDDFAAFIELWSRSDFFVAAESCKSLFQCTPKGERNYYALFGRLMDDVAHRRGCRFWLQKIAPSEGLAVLNNFPQAKVVLIWRQLADVVASQAKLHIRYGEPPQIPQTVFDYVFQLKHLKAITRRHPEAACVTYEQLQSDTQAHMFRVCQHLGLPIPASELTSSYQPNSSFDASRSQLSSSATVAVYAYASMLTALPLSALRAASWCKQVVRGKQAPPRFASGEFGAIKDALLKPRVLVTEGARRSEA